MDIGIYGCGYGHKQLWMQEDIDTPGYGHRETKTQMHMEISNPNLETNMQDGESRKGRAGRHVSTACSGIWSLHGIHAGGKERGGTQQSREILHVIAKLGKRMGDDELGWELKSPSDPEIRGWPGNFWNRISAKRQGERWGCAEWMEDLWVKRFCRARGNANRNPKDVKTGENRRKSSNCRPVATADF